MKYRELDRDRAMAGAREQSAQSSLRLPSIVLAPGAPKGVAVGIASGTDSSDVMMASEVAGLLRMNVKTVYDLAKAGEIPSWRLGRRFRFSRRALMASLGQCRSASHREGK